MFMGRRNSTPFPENGYRPPRALGVGGEEMALIEATDDSQFAFGCADRWRMAQDGSALLA